MMLYLPFSLDVDHPEVDGLDLKVERAAPPFLLDFPLDAFNKRQDIMFTP